MVLKAIRYDGTLSFECALNLDSSFEELKKMGISFDVRKVPSDSKDNMDAIIEKAKAELGLN